MSSECSKAREQGGKISALLVPLVATEYAGTGQGLSRNQVNRGSSYSAPPSSARFHVYMLYCARFHRMCLNKGVRHSAPMFLQV